MTPEELEVEGILRIALAETLGWAGRMISDSKSGYRLLHPNGVPVFNANVVADFMSGPTKIWFGDLDLTLDGDKLQSLADRLETTVWVLREHDGRFENEKQPLVEKAVATFKPT